MERTQRIRKAKDALNIPDIIKIEREGEYISSVTIRGINQSITVSGMGMHIDLAVDDSET